MSNIKERGKVSFLNMYVSKESIVYVFFHVKFKNRQVKSVVTEIRVVAMIVWT